MSSRVRGIVERNCFVNFVSRMVIFHSTGDKYFTSNPSFSEPVQEQRSPSLRPRRRFGLSPLQAHGEFLRLHQRILAWSITSLHIEMKTCSFESAVKLRDFIGDMFLYEREIPSPFGETWKHKKSFERKRIRTLNS